MQVENVKRLICWISQKLQGAVQDGVFRNECRCGAKAIEYNDGRNCNCEETGGPKASARE